MTGSRLEGFTAGVLGHSSYKVSENTVRLFTFEDVRKMCLALMKQRYSYSLTFDHPKLAMIILEG